MTINKLVTALVGALAFALYGALADDVMSVTDWVQTGALVLAAFGTWLVPNTARLAAAKLWVSALVVGSGVLVPLLVGGVSGQEWMQVLIAVLTAAGVYLVPNKNRDFRATTD